MGKAGDFVLSKHSGETEKVENKSGWQKGLGKWFSQLLEGATCEKDGKKLAQCGWCMWHVGPEWQKCPESPESRVEADP